MTHRRTQELRKPRGLTGADNARWIFSDDCNALNKQQKSELLCSLFNVRPVQTYNSFEVKVEHHDIDILMTFENGQPQCTNNVWMKTTYKDFSKALKDVLFDANINDDYIILKEYMCYISNLASWQEVLIFENLKVEIK